MQIKLVRVSGSAALLAACGALGACSTKTPGGSCGDEASCQPGQVCISDTCRQLCSAPADCGGECCHAEGYCAACGGAAPQILAIDSDGSDDGQSGRAPHHLGLSLVVSGNNLAGATADLDAVDAGLASYAGLPITLGTAHELVATLPLTLKQGTYTLVVTNQGGADQATITVLQGEPGRDGTDLTGAEIITMINDARGTGSLLVADRLGALAPADVATVTMVDALDARASDLESSLDALQATAEGVCRGVLYNHVCVLKYDRTDPGFTWLEAVNNCTMAGGDLCTASQYLPLRGEAWYGNQTLFYSGRAVWTADFSDNDGGVKSVSVYASDDPSITEQYAYGCCLNVTPEPYRSRATLYRPTGSTTGGVRTTYVHNMVDTTFTAAAFVCTSMGSDLCTKSQYLALRDNGLFLAGTPVWTNEQSDNDANLFNDFAGPTADNPGWSSLYAYACCASQRPVDNSCPSPAQLVGGVCLVSKHDTSDASFHAAARACTTLGANVCSKSQMQVLRNQTQFSGSSWTNDGADNDSTRVGGVLGTQPDNPNPTTDRFGYACCL
jgi:hypothetical protein